MACAPAPSCKAALAEATRLWPNRNRASDGICASPRHTQQNPTSDHEVGNAFDLTDDKANGCDADAFAELLRSRRDDRVKYVICNHRMFSSYATSTRAAWQWGPYTGPNPHEKHTHVSIKPEARRDTRPWFEPVPNWHPPMQLHPEDEMRYPADQPYLPLKIEANGQGSIAIPVAFADITSVVVKANDNWTHPEARVLPTVAQDGKSTVLSAVGKPGTVGVIVGYRAR